jgi:hypothetical protein
MSCYPGTTFRIDFPNDAGGAFIINSSGNIGIGKSSPTTKLDVNGAINVGNTTINGSLTLTGGITSQYIKKRVLYAGDLVHTHFSLGSLISVTNPNFPLNQLRSPTNHAC